MEAFGAEPDQCQSSVTLNELLICRYPELRIDFEFNKNAINELSFIAKEKRLEAWWYNRSQHLKFSHNYPQECGVWMRENMNFKDEEIKCIKNNVSRKNTALRKLLDRKIVKKGLSVQSIDLKSINSDVFYTSKKIDLISLSVKRTEDQTGIVPVKVDRPNKDVILVLCSDDKVLWELDISSHTKIERIYLCMSIPIVYSPSIAIASNSARTVKAIPIYTVVNQYSRGFQSNLIKFKEYFNVTKVDYFHASEYLSAPIIIDEASKVQEGWSLDAKYSITKIEENFRFRLVDETFSYVDWSISGPLEEDFNKRYVVRNLVVDSKGYVLFRYRYGILQKYIENVGYVNIDIPEDYPKSEIISLSYSETRQVLYVAFKNDRFIYCYDIKEQNWLKKIFVGQQILGISVDSKSDHISVSKDYAELVVVDSNSGKTIYSLNLSDYLPGLSLLKPAPIQIVIEGDQLAVVRIMGKHVTHVWYGNINKMNFYLTYRNDRI